MENQVPSVSCSYSRRPPPTQQPGHCSGAAHWAALQRCSTQPAHVIIVTSLQRRGQGTPPGGNWVILSSCYIFSMASIYIFGLLKITRNFLMRERIRLRFLFI